MRFRDICQIASGVYRETVTLQCDDVSLVAAEGEEVILTGLDKLDAGWTLVEGEIYKTLIPGPVLQVFAGGRRMERARHPNTYSVDLLRPTLGKAAAGQDAPSPELSWIRSPDIDLPGVSWTGAQVWILSGSRWVAHTLEVKAHSADTVFFLHPKGGEYHYRIGPGTEFYLSGTVAALDADREWFYDPSAATLYFNPPGNDRPRNYGRSKVAGRLPGPCASNGHNGIPGQRQSNP